MKKCPKCGREFQTPAALRQHEADKHGMQPGSKKQGMPRSRRGRGRQGGVPAIARKTPLTGGIRVNNGTVSVRPGENVSNIMDEYSGTPGAGDFGKGIHLSEILDKYDLADSDAGRAWVKKVLNPCDESPVGPNGIPDMACDMVVPFHFREANTIESGQTQGTWDVALVTTPYPDRPVVYFKKKASADWSAPTTGYVSGSIDLTEWDKQVTKFRLMYQGMTCYLDAGATFSEGMVYSFTTTPRIRKSIITSTTVSEKQEKKEEPDEEQQFFGEVDLDELIAEIDEYCESISHFEGKVKTSEAATQVDADLAAKVRKEIWNSLWTEEKIMNTASARMSNARHGLYTINRPATDAVNFRDNDKVLIDLRGPDASYASSWTTSSPKDEVGDADFTYSYVIFKGLDYRANVVVKVREGFEVIPAPDSTAALMQNPSPLLDEKALRTVTKLMQILPSSFPAEANDLGAILGPITQVLGSLGIPYLSTAAKGVGAALPVADQLMRLFKGI